MARVTISLVIGMILLGFTGCSTVEKKEVPTGQLASGPQTRTMQGIVDNIVKVPKTASFWKEAEGAVVGGLIGSTIGDGKGQDVSEDAGVLIGSDVMDQEYGSSIDQLFIKGEDGNEYKCYVKAQTFKFGQTVEFSLVKGHITAIDHKTKD